MRRPSAAWSTASPALSVDADGSRGGGGASLAARQASTPRSAADTEKASRAERFADVSAFDDDDVDAGASVDARVAVAVEGSRPPSLSSSELSSSRWRRAASCS